MSAARRPACPTRAPPSAPVNRQGCPTRSAPTRLRRSGSRPCRPSRRRPPSRSARRRRRPPRRSPAPRPASRPPPPPRTRVRRPTRRSRCRACPGGSPSRTPPSPTTSRAPRPPRAGRRSRLRSRPARPTRPPSPTKAARTGRRGPGARSTRRGGVRLGFAVKVLGDGGLPSHDARRWQSGPHLRHSLEALDAVFGYLGRHGIRMYRMTASLAPYATHPDLPQFHAQVDECRDELAALGARAAALGLRLSSHPGQYVVLNSEDPGVRAAAARDLELQAELMDAMALGPEAVVVLHVGGAAGGHPAARDRFLAGLDTLSDRARERLVIENDDRTFSLADVLALHERTGLRVVWDILHHHCHDPDGIPDREALERALATWPRNVTPKIHFSSPKTAMEERKRRVGRRIERTWVLPQLRAHADVIDPIAFEQFLRETAAGLDFDVMLEAKAKDLALLRLRDQLARRAVPAAEVHQPQ